MSSSSAAKSGTKRPRRAARVNERVSTRAGADWTSSTANKGSTTDRGRGSIRAGVLKRRKRSRNRRRNAQIPARPPRPRKRGNKRPTWLRRSRSRPRIAACGRPISANSTRPSRRWRRDLPAWTKKLLGRDVLVNGADAAVKGFQRAINASTKPPAFDYRWGLGGRQGRIEVDGDLGPQTRAGLGRAIEKQGQDGFSKLYALDQFGRYVKNVDRGRAKLDDLEDAIGGTLGQAIQDASERAQEALNMFAEDREETGAPLKIDGWIGPKTTEAFGTLLRKTSPERVMARFAGKDFWNDDDLA
jgi:hypothetical protein